MRRIMLAMSQEKLGAALGLTFQQVQKYEKGRRCCIWRALEEESYRHLQDVGDLLQPAGPDAVGGWGRTRRLSRADKSNQCPAFCGKAFGHFSSAAELLFYLEFAASALKKAAQRT